MKLANYEVMHLAVWSIAKSLTERSGPEEASAVHGPIDLIFYPVDKANRVADSLENQFRANDVCDCDHR
jgi:hypothetical protein